MPATCERAAISRAKETAVHMYRHAELLDAEAEITDVVAKPIGGANCSPRITAAQ